ncbi:hypothetical protein MNBD_BACTEROID01-330 [hydrothermal vent metagenome]|uniref:Uncharacterized protein n=1 Tax=hydrothermal vent metagenome TaxID=652676 RepID=A0A3B0TQH0_9ZZZZ
MLKDKKNIHAGTFLDEALKHEPDFFLPDDFADKMALEIEKRLAWSQYLKEFIIYFGVIAGIIVIALAIIFFFDAESWANLANIFLSNINTIVGVGLIILFVFFTDKVLLRYFSHKAKLMRQA